MEFIQSKSEKEEPKLKEPKMEEVCLKVEDKKMCYLCYIKYEKLILLDTLFTPQEFRGNGYARKLLDDFITKETLPIFLVVRIGTFVGGFYQRMGFKRIATFGHYDLMAKSDKTDDELLKIWLNH
jgi:GNAT superfamily N-acetyltransferase